MPGESHSTPREIQNYLGRISGPLLDRIDLHIEVPPVKFHEISAERTGETSAQIRERVIKARRRQHERRHQQQHQHQRHQHHRRQQQPGRRHGRPVHH